MYALNKKISSKSHYMCAHRVDGISEHVHLLHARASVLHELVLQVVKAEEVSTVYANLHVHVQRAEKMLDEQAAEYRKLKKDNLAAIKEPSSAGRRRCDLLCRIEKYRCDLWKEALYDEKEVIRCCLHSCSRAAATRGPMTESSFDLCKVMRDFVVTLCAGLTDPGAGGNTTTSAQRSSWCQGSGSRERDPQVLSGTRP
jgi:hypothetical protein